VSEARAIGGTRTRLRRAAGAAVLVAVALITARTATERLSTDAISGPSRAVAALDPADQAGDVVALPPLVDGPGRAETTELPQDEGPAHRTWFAVGTWWAVLPDPVSGVHRIWWLSGPDGPWIDTGTLVDERPDARIEVAWDGEDLVISATGTRAYRSHALRLHRYSWSEGDRAWVPAPDHPIELTTEGEPGARMVLTPDGTAWLVRPRGLGLEVNRTAGRSPRSAGWTPLPVDGLAADVGGFDVVVDGDDVVIVWRRAAADALVVVRRQGEQWAREEIAVPGIAGMGPVDAAIGPAGGSLTALVSTTADHGAAGDQAPALLLVGLPSPGRSGPTPPVSVVARASDGLQRASLLVDGERARVLAIAPPTVDEVSTWYARGQGAPTALVEKVAPLAEPLFIPGSGTRLMSGVDGVALARPLLPSTLPPEAGLVAVVSGGDATRWSTWADGVRRPPEPAPSATAGGEMVLVNDTFDSLPLGGPGPTAWAPEDADPPVGEVIADEVVAGRALRLAGGSDPTTACRPIPELPGEVVTVEVAVRTLGTGTADARLVTIRGPSGSLASARLSRLGLAGWSTSTGRVTGGGVAPGTLLRITIRLALATRTADIGIRTEDGAVVAEVAGLPWLTSGDAVVDELCLRPAPGGATALEVASVRVIQR